MLKKILVLVIVAFLAHRIYRLCLFLGFHHTIFNHHPGPCRTLPNIDRGSEDIELLPGDKALITSGLRLLERSNKNFAGLTGSVHIFDFSRPEAGVKPVIIKDFKGLDDCDFHGMSVYVNDKTGEVEVYIVNHLVSSSVVERFIYNDQEVTLYHKETFADDTFKLLNDVVVVGHRQFYASNFLYTRNILELVAQLHWSPIAFYDGQKGHVVSKEGLLLGNGIAQSRDGRYIYVSHTFDRELQIHKRNKDNSLDLIQKVPLYFMADNIFVDPDTGDLWIAGHVGGIYTAAYGPDPLNNVSPSKVIRVRIQDGAVRDITEVFVNDGTLHSGSSTGVYRKNQLLIGSIHTTTTLCDVKYV